MEKSHHNHIPPLLPPRDCPNLNRYCLSHNQYIDCMLRNLQLHWAMDHHRFVCSTYSWLTDVQSRHGATSSPAAAKVGKSNSRVLRCSLNLSQQSILTAPMLSSLHRTMNQGQGLALYGRQDTAKFWLKKIMGYRENEAPNN